MKPVAPECMPGEQALAGFAQYEAALDTLVANGVRTLRIFDKVLGPGFNSPLRYDLLHRLLLAGRHHRVFIALHETANIVRDCPRLMMLLRTFSHGIAIRQTLPAARRVYDPFAIADDTRFVRRFHFDDMRGVATVGDYANISSLVKRFDDIWEASTPAVGATTLGL